MIPGTSASLRARRPGEGDDGGSMNRLEVVNKIREIIDADTDDPAEELVKMGEVLIKIGKSLQGLSIEEARKVLRAVTVLA